jgi:hypothetical protein
MLDGTQKEVADLLILYKDSGVLVSQKAQWAKEVSLKNLRPETATIQ